MIKTRIGGAAALLVFGLAAVGGAPLAAAETGDVHTGPSVTAPRMGGQEVVPRGTVIPRHGDDGGMGASHTAGAPNGTSAGVGDHVSADDAHKGLGDAWTDHWRQITREREIGHR